MRRRQTRWASGSGRGTGSPSARASIAPAVRIQSSPPVPGSSLGSGCASAVHHQ
ncbi:hypothetical protein ACFQ0M_03405 [Kitasatospora aburaviensis]